MKGNNEIRLNEATMIEVVQFWLDSVIPADTPKVIGVGTDNSGVSARGYVVRITSDNGGIVEDSDV